ncbi:E3 ubiquitin/ISG15 ligase TRIM25-like, partial [Polypterus senegalus]|uniref:E3 ubiquitin/ISG15 ligase TRIM25-like n=1 Tax=Polypterus senegalus TaxID=55291 RepID=UPI0019645959
MAEAHLCGLQDEFTCLVCLHTLTDPVAIPCGHNFCLKCLTDCWYQSQELFCPGCRETISTRPALQGISLLNEVINKLKKTALNSLPSQSYAGPGDMECDACTGKKFRAEKSCLTCMAYYCQTHLQPHYEGDTLKLHKLTDPDRNMKEKLSQRNFHLRVFTSHFLVCLTDSLCLPLLRLMMAEAHLCGLQDEFTCLVCLHTLTDPVAIPCGHNFCLKCLTDCWYQSQELFCPGCRETISTRPALQGISLLNEVINKLKKTALNSLPSQSYAGPGDMECDACTGKKFRAEKSCLTCMAYYCQTHLQPHYEGDTLKLHKLTDPDRNMKEKLCEKHQKSLEIFCKTDDSCICMMCVVTGHNGHKMVELETEREEKQKQLGATLSDIKRTLEDRE